MRMMMKVSIPVEAGNEGIRDGKLAQTVLQFVEQMKPEAVYFVADGGTRTAIFVFDLQDPSFIPPAAEPFFLQLSAAIELTPAMNLEDMKAGLGRAAHG